MTAAIVVGSGPNGLAAGIELAGHGVEVTVLEAHGSIGGGTRSEIHTVDGLIHDDCSAFHPTALASPFLTALALDRHGLVWRHPEIVLAHPLDGGRAAALWRDLERTCDAMGEDGAKWGRAFAPLVARFGDLADDAFRPLLHVPSHPVTLARFGLAGLPPATWFVRRWSRPETQALFGGTAAHLMGPLRQPLSSSVGVLLTAAAHAHGWPVAQGGSQSIATALATELRSRGGKIETGVRVDDLDTLGGHDLVMLDVSPQAALRITGDRLPARIATSYRRYRHGPAAFKVDLAVDGHVPWLNEHCRRAGTVHVAGSFAEIELAERDVVAGRMPSRPFVLFGQQYLADPSRSSGTVNPIWLYAHVPAGYTGDATESMLDQVERFAPGLRDRVVATHVRDVTAMEAYNANYVGGNIAGGATDIRQLLMRPRLTTAPYDTGIPGVYLCSSATPPGAGVHGMCGFNAARAALRHLERRHAAPSRAR